MMLNQFGWLSLTCLKLKKTNEKKKNERYIILVELLHILRDLFNTYTLEIQKEYI